MANPRLPIRKIKEVLCLKHYCRLSRRQIAQSFKVGRSTVPAERVGRAQSMNSVMTHVGRGCRET